MIVCLCSLCLLFSTDDHALMKIASKMFSMITIADRFLQNVKYENCFIWIAKFVHAMMGVLCFYDASFQLWAPVNFVQFEIGLFMCNAIVSVANMPVYGSPPTE